LVHFILADLRVADPNGDATGDFDLLTLRLEARIAHRASRVKLEIQKTLKEE